MAWTMGAGNIAEWAQDWFGFDYDAYMPERIRPATDRVVQERAGRSWKRQPVRAGFGRPTPRRRRPPMLRARRRIGFRCARSLTIVESLAFRNRLGGRVQTLWDAFSLGGSSVHWSRN